MIVNGVVACDQRQELLGPPVDMAFRTFDPSPVSATVSYAAADTGPDLAAATAIDTVSMDLVPCACNSEAPTKPLTLARWVAAALTSRTGPGSARRD